MRFMRACSRRWLVWLGLALAIAPRAWADDAAAGTWGGTYVCGQGNTALTLILRPGRSGGGLDGLFYFHASPNNAGVPEGCFAMSGRFDKQSRELHLSAGRWLLQPFGYVTVDLRGRLEPGGARLHGSVIGPLCQGFDLHRVSSRPTTVLSACLGSADVASVDADR